MNDVESMCGISVDAQYNLGYIEFADGYTEYIVHYQQMINQYEWVVQTNKHIYLCTANENLPIVYRIIKQDSQYIYQPVCVINFALKSMNTLRGPEVSI